MLVDAGHAVRVVVTEPALHFFDPDELRGVAVERDRDEWPERRWRRDDPVPHVAIRDWADLLVIAPLDANTLGKCALGLCDNFLTCVVRAWDFRHKPAILAPAMNTQMWHQPVTRRHFAMLLADHGEGTPPEGWTLDEVDAVFAHHAPRILIVPPIAKRLACGDVGVGAMAEVVTIANVVHRVNGSSDERASDAVGDREA